MIVCRKLIKVYNYIVLEYNNTRFIAVSILVLMIVIIIMYNTFCQCIYVPVLTMLKVRAFRGGCRGRQAAKILQQVGHNVV